MAFDYANNIVAGLVGEGDVGVPGRVFLVSAACVVWCFHDAWAVEAVARLTLRRPWLQGLIYGMLRPLCCPVETLRDSLRPVTMEIPLSRIEHLIAFECRVEAWSMLRWG